MPAKLESEAGWPPGWSLPQECGARAVAALGGEEELARVLEAEVEAELLEAEVGTAHPNRKFYRNFLISTLRSQKLQAELRRMLGTGDITWGELLPDLDLNDQELTLRAEVDAALFGGCFLGKKWAFERLLRGIRCESMFEATKEFNGTWGVPDTGAVQTEKERLEFAYGSPVVRELPKAVQDEAKDSESSDEAKDSESSDEAKDYEFSHELNLNASPPCALSLRDWFGLDSRGDGEPGFRCNAGWQPLVDSMDGRASSGEFAVLCSDEYDQSCNPAAALLRNRWGPAAVDEMLGRRRYLCQIWTESQGCASWALVSDDPEGLQNGVVYAFSGGFSFPKTEESLEKGETQPVLSSLQKLKALIETPFAESREIPALSAGPPNPQGLGCFFLADGAGLTSFFRRLVVEIQLETELESVTVASRRTIQGIQQALLRESAGLRPDWLTRNYDALIEHYAAGLAGGDGGAKKRRTDSSTASEEVSTGTGDK